MISGKLLTSLCSSFVGNQDSSSAHLTGFLQELHVVVHVKQLRSEEDPARPATCLDLVGGQSAESQFPPSAYHLLHAPVGKRRSGVALPGQGISKAQSLIPTESPALPPPCKLIAAFSHAAPVSPWLPELLV